MESETTDIQKIIALSGTVNDLKRDLEFMEARMKYWREVALTEISRRMNDGA